MGFRRKLNNHDAWLLYVHENAQLLSRSGIPQSIVNTERRFRQFLTSGRGEGLDGAVARLTDLSQDQFNDLLTFVLAVHPLSDDVGLFDAFNERRVGDAE